MREADSFKILEKLPTKLAERLMPFQRAGIKYALEKNGRCLIADEMGLGKTLQALSVAYLYKSEWPLLIIVPSSLRFCWVEEIEKWFPDTSPEDIFMVQTGNDASWIQNAKIVIATYGLLSKTSSKVVLQALTNQNFQVVIVDESHYIRNIKTASCKAISPLIRNANRRILLSGTPSLSKPVELFSQIDAVCPNKFGSWWTYTAHFCDARIQHIGKIRKRNVDGSSNLAELQKKLKDLLMIRRMKDDVLTQLPAKQRQQILFQLKDSQVTKDIQKTFQELKSSMKRDRCQVENVCDIATNDGCSGNTLSLIQKLYQLSGEAKIGPARDYVAMLCDNKNLKFLVFAYHRAMMNGLQQTLMEHDVKFVRIDGETKPSDRQLYVQQFQSDPDTRVAILSILAAGVGLTFTKATLVVFAEMYWTPGVLIQCEDRAHRIGQTRCVSVHYLVAKDTMDEWVWSAICRKTIVTTTTLNGQKQVMKADKGDKYQVDLLSAADVYKAPSTEEAGNTDFASIFASQQPKDQPSILDFISSGKKRKREEGNVFRKKRKSFINTQDSEDVIELLDSDGENEIDENTPPRDQNNIKSHSQENSLKSKGKIKDLSQRMLFSQQQNDEEDEFVFGKTKLTRKPLHMKKADSLSDTWSCSGCTFQNHADLPYCEMCNTPKNKRPMKSSQKKDKGGLSASLDSYLKDGVLHKESQENSNVLKCNDSKRSMKSSQKSDEGSLSASLDLPVKDSVVESQENSNVLICDAETCHNENLFQLSSGCDNSSSALKKEESFDQRDIEDDQSTCEQCDKERQSEDTGSISMKSKQRRRTFFLETYSPNLKSGADQSSQSSENSNCKDQCTKSKQDIYEDDGIEYPDKEERTGGNDQEMSCSQELTDSEESTVELQSCEDSSQPTQSALSDSVTEGDLDTTRETDDGGEMFDDDWDQEVLSQDVESTKTEDNVVIKDISAVPVYKSFWYKCSAYTSRIYLYNETGDSLQANFVPLDVEMNNQGNLPDILLHPQNLRLVQKFMREWNSLTETKRRLIVKASTLFDSPLVAYETLKSDRCVTTIRHKTKEDIAAESLAKANQIQGNVRVVKRSHQSETSLLQATTSDGIPICLNCSKPCDSSLLSKETLKDSDSAWATRFCSQKCMNKYWIQTNSSYCRDQLYEAEHGVCQLCSFDAHSLYRQIRDTDDVQKRVDILHSSIFDKLNPKQKEAIVKNPVAGQFWHVDHIQAVWEGGGQCDIDNFRTLCVLCHQKVTAQQARKRATIRKLGVATGMADISAFFQPA